MSENILESGKLYELWAWYEANRKRVHTWAAIITLVGVAVAYAIWSAEQKQMNANTALFRLGEPLNIIAGGEVPAESLLKMAEQYAGTSASERAAAQAGALLFQAGEYQKALDTFTEFSQKYPKSDLAASAAYGIAVSQDALGKDEEALMAYQSVIQKYPLLADLSKINMASIYESKGELDKAVLLYDEISKTLHRGWASMAMSRAREIRLEHPELEKKPEIAQPAITPQVELPVTSIEETPTLQESVPPMLERPVEMEEAPPAEATPSTTEAAEPEE
ncbi:MAG: tetratricopeptide repeat protein [Limisphaerales bacterium]|jgi:tetratricopeptide (TPR) repeat protein|nr:tetratricopeptide repeat protein [Verrucomicrobiota bacterium]